MRKLFKVFGYFLIVLILGAEGVAFWQRENLADWVKLRNYVAPQDIAQLAADTSMTDLGKKYFYVNKPALEDRERFNYHCRELVEQTAVLGCYRGNRQGIYIYKITDSRLFGIQQVTAAHEMLHQAYDRLSDGEKAEIDRQLQDYFSVSEDADLRQKMASYQNTEPDNLATERFAVFGTEVKGLPEYAESIYERFFSDRGKIVDYAKGYQSEFSRREKQIADLQEELADLKVQIEAKDAKLTRTNNDLERRLKLLDSKAIKQDAVLYKAEVANYNSLVNTYNLEVADLKKMVEDYNSKVSALQAIATEENELYQAMDSRHMDVYTKQ